MTKQTKPNLKNLPHGCYLFGAILLFSGVITVIVMCMAVVYWVINFL